LTLTLTLTNHKNQGIMNQVETILEKEYIPFIENYMIHELVSAFKGSASSNWIDLSDSSDSFNSSIGKKSDSIISSYLTFVKLICECCKLIYYLPSHQESFERIMEQLCDQLLDKSEVKLRDLILVKSCGDDESSSNLLCFSVQFAKNAEIREILNQNGLLQGTSPNVQLNRLLSEKEAIVMERLKGDRSIGKNELLFDPKVLRELALLQRSFEQVKGLIFKGKYEKSCTEAHSDEGMTKIIEDESKNLHLHVYEDGRKSIFKFGSLFDAKFLIFSELIEKLGQTCLFTLHCEIRTHSFYFLDLAFREGSYKLDQIPVTVNEPDPYVLNWTGDLMNLADSFSDWFPLSKYLFLFDGLPILIDSILVNNFQYIKAINQEGCNKLSTNTTAILQILTQLLPPTQVSLPKSTEYYRLAQIPCDQLVSEIQASSTPFTFLQYRALLDLAYRREALLQENNESSKKAYMNHLTMLKYMTTQQQP
jgi:exocyst complex component 4